MTKVTKVKICERILFSLVVGGIDDAESEYERIFKIGLIFSVLDVGE
jgi:hypothetical protein